MVVSKWNQEGRLKNAPQLSLTPRFSGVLARAMEENCFNSFLEPALEKQYLRRGIFFAETEIVWRIGNLDETASRWVTGICLDNKSDRSVAYNNGENKRTIASRSFAA